MKSFVRINRSLVCLAAAFLFTPLASQALTEGNYGYSINAAGQATITSFNRSYSGSVNIPDTLGGYPVVSIGPNAFAWAAWITDVTIPFGVTNLNSVAFRDCTRLTTVSLPASMKIIVPSAFDFCYALTAIHVDEANPNFSSENGVLFNKTKTILTRVPGGWSGLFSIPEGVTAVSGTPFAYCNQLTSLAIPASVKGGLSGFMFRDCPSLTTFIVDPANTVFATDESGALLNKMRTRLIRLPPTFAGSYTVSNTVTSLDVAFMGCSRLTDVYIPQKVTGLPMSAFDRCNALNSITVDEANPIFSSIDGFLLNKAGTVLMRCPSGKQGAVTLPGGMIDIEPSGYTNVVSSSITNIASNAFAYCTRIGSVTIPASVAKLSGTTFMGCTALSSVYCEGNAPAVDGTLTFSGTPATIFYLPSTTGWGSKLAGHPTALWNGIIQNGYPENAYAKLRPGYPYVEIYYDLVSSSSNRLSVMAVASRDNGATWDIELKNRFGDIGSVVPGKRRIIWRAGTDLPNESIPEMRIRVSTPYGSADTPPFPFNTHSASNSTLRAWADKNSNRLYDTGEEVPYAEVYYDGRTPSHFKGMTDGSGLFILGSSLREGAQLFIRKAIHVEPAVKAGHEQVGNAMYTLWLDSDYSGGDENPGDGTWSCYKITPSDLAKAQFGQSFTVKLSHPVFEWNLVVAAEIKSEAFIAKLQDSFRKASEYLFDVTDGQMKFGRVAIYSNVSEGSAAWRNADMVIHSDSDYWPNAYVGCIRHPGNYHMNFGTDWKVWGPSGFTLWYHRVIVHEFGHYGFALYDEYLDGNRSQADWDVYRRRNPDKVPANYGFMDYTYTTDEMSSENDYLPFYGPGVQAEEITGELMAHDLAAGSSWYPCWQWIEANYQTTYSGIPVEIVTPPSGSYPDHVSEDRSGPTSIPAPYTSCDFPAMIAMSADPARNFNLAAAPAQESTGSVQIEVSIDEQPAAGASVLRKPNGSSRVFALGRGDASGCLTIWDIAEGDSLVARYNGLEAEHVVDFNEIESGLIRIDIAPKRDALAQGGLRLLGDGTEGALGVLVSAKTDAVGPDIVLTLTVQASEAITEPPAATVYPNNGAAVVLVLAPAGDDLYTGSVSIGEADGGTVELSCRSADGEIASSTDPFAVVGMAPDASAIFYSRDGWVETHLPVGSVAGNCLATFYSGYLPTLIPEGFNKAPVGAVIYGTLGVNENLNGDPGVVNMSYREADLIGIDETTIKLYSWNSAVGAWTEIPSTLSVDLNVVSASLSNLGFLALFADSTEDVAPPAQISDFRGETGTNGWDVVLSWTDVGDDGIEGKATAYVLKYNTSEITAPNWESCTKYILNINPETAGSNRTQVVSMPAPGVHYYFGIMAQDEAGNLGPLSNIADAASYSGDADGDQMSDQWEYTYGLNPTNSADAASDADDDGLTNLEEWTLQTNPISWDTDGDGMGDKWEADNALNPLSPADKDGDDDNDGLQNFTEHLEYTNPLSVDSDEDGMPDKWELDYEFDPASTSGDSGADSDPDGDAFSNLSEFIAGTSPTNSSSQFLADIVNGNGAPRIVWNPDLGESRQYIVEGKTNLSDADWHSPTNASSRFFRIKVEMNP